MINNKKILLLLGLSLLGTFIGVYLLKFYECGRSVACHNLTTNAFALIYAMPALAFVFSILLFVPKAAPAWKKFAIWFIPLAALIFIAYPDPGSGDLFSPYPEQVYRWVSILYVVLSLGVIALAMSKRS